MGRFKVTPISKITGAVAPSSIHDFDDNKDIEVQAEAATHLTSKYPHVWLASTTKLSPCKIDMRKGRDNGQ